MAVVEHSTTSCTEGIARCRESLHADSMHWQDLRMSLLQKNKLKIGYLFRKFFQMHNGDSRFNLYIRL